MLQYEVLEVGVILEPLVVVFSGEPLIPESPHLQHRKTILAFALKKRSWDLEGGGGGGGT